MRVQDLFIIIHSTSGPSVLYGDHSQKCRAHLSDLLRRTTLEEPIKAVYWEVAYATQIQVVEDEGWDVSLV